MAVAVSWHLGSKPLFVDEGFSVAMARLPWSQFWHIVTTREANQSLHYLMLRGLVHAGATERWLRLIPAVAAVATVPALFAVGRRLFTDRIGLLAGLLLCLNGFFIFHGQYSRAYSMVVLLVTVSSLLFLRALDQPTPARWLSWAAISALACYAHFFAVLVVAAQLLSLAFYERARLRRQPLAVGLGAVAVLLAPLAVFIAVVPGDQVDFIPAPTLHDLFHSLDSLAGHGGPALMVVLGVFGILSMVELGQRWRGPSRRSDTWPIVFALTWLVVPIVAAFAVSLLKPIVQDEYLIVSLPGLMVLAAVGLDQIVASRRPVALAVAAGALVVLGGRSVIQVYGHGNDENW
jgi:mannosyltransferase